ncbi:MAG TPA: endopeptidase La [Desulfomonilia bacterium]
MFAMIVRDNVFFPHSSFSLKVSPEMAELLKLQGELAIFFKTPMSSGDIGVRCLVREAHDDTVIIDGECRVRSMERMDGEIGDIRVTDVPDWYEKNLLNEGLIQGVRALVKLVFPNSVNLMKEKNPGNFADMVAANIDLPIQEKMRFLYTPDSMTRIKLVFGYLNRISPKAQRANNSKAGNPMAEETKELEERIERTPLPEEARTALNKEMGRLKYMHQYSPEYTVSRSYIEFILDMPWEIRTQDFIDIEKAKEVLDRDHFNLKDAKERILEFLAVKKLKADSKGSIICFVGPPGVGKTSLGKSIAEAMGRKYIRMSLGGIRDEAEIRGHRRTYIGAMPGRIIKEIQRAGTMNPVFILDEIDKLGKDFRGDPASAMLEVLDPEQNFSFKDNYMEIPFDLSQVMFIATANTTETIPATLLDRMEIIDIAGYSDDEKLNIAKLHLIRKKAAESGLENEPIIFDDEATMMIINSYTVESGVRDLERKIESLFRKIAKRKASDLEIPERVTCEIVREYLGPVTRYKEQAMNSDCIGISTGLAWTPAGGEILLIEVSSMPGSGKIELTGNMGQVMQESARIAIGYLKSRIADLVVEPVDFSKIDIHIHVPAGAISKDGPSAGLAILCALLSYFQARPVRSDTAITGEVTLSGRVLPVGGIKEKVLAAERAGISRVILPAKNEADILKLTTDVSLNLEIIYVSSFGDAAQLFFRDELTSIPVSA